MFKSTNKGLTNDDNQDKEISAFEINEIDLERIKNISLNRKSIEKISFRDKQIQD